MLLSAECEQIIREKTTAFLLEISIPVNLQGFKYIRDAVISIVKDPRNKRGVTKKLYPAIAEKYDVSVSIVERAIRHAIEVACARGCVGIVNRLLKCPLWDNEYKPTISELISLVGERMLAEAKKIEFEKLGLV